MSKSRTRICIWYDRTAREAAEFYAATFPDSAVTGSFAAPGDYPDGKAGDELVVEFTVLGIPFMGLNGGPQFPQSEAFSIVVTTDTQEETDRYWNAIVGHGGRESDCGWCKDKWGVNWQITPRVLTDALERGGAVARAAFGAMLTMRKLDHGAIQAAIDRAPT